MSASGADARRYALTIVQRPDGTYAGRLESDDGDLWCDLTQMPQEGEQFRRSLIAFAEACGIAVCEPGPERPKL